MIEGIHHIGIAVRDVETVAAFLKEMFDAEFIGENRLETGEFLSRMMRIGNSILELLEPRGEGGLIERFLDQRGEGIHHYGLRTDDVADVLERCDDKGVRVLGRRFIHPKSAHGMLIEILDKDESF